MLLHEDEDEDEEDEESVKIMFYLYFIPHLTFSSNFLHTVTFLHVLHTVTFLHVLYLDILKRQIEIGKLKLVIISFSRSKRVNRNIICLCTSSGENLLTCKISGPKLLQLLSYASS